MFNSVAFVRELCRQKGIAVSRLEADCGFSNGYLNPKKMTKLPYDRAQVIARYLEVSVQYILTGEDTDSVTDRNSVSDEDIKFALFGGSGEITDAMYEEVRRFAAFVKQREAEKKRGDQEETP